MQKGQNGQNSSGWENVLCRKQGLIRVPPSRLKGKDVPCGFVDPSSGVQGVDLASGPALFFP